MFNQYPLFCEFSVFLLFLFTETTLFFPSKRSFAVFVNFCNPLITGIGKYKDMRLYNNFTFFEESEIMCSSIAEIRSKNFPCLKINDYLNFLREAFFLSTVMEPTLFFGRSIGCSEASINTVFKSERYDILFLQER